MARLGWFAQVRDDYLGDKQPERYKRLKETGRLFRHCEKMEKVGVKKKIRLMVDRGLRDYEANEIVISELCQ
jgi:hypothetical protein